MIVIKKPSAKMVVVNGMNHIFKIAEADRAKQIASYGDPTLSVAPKLIDEVVDFVRVIQGSKQ
jgi:uncharacterized protein